MSSDDTVPDAMYSQDQLPEMMAQCDYIVIAAPLTPETRHMVGVKEFAAAKEGSVVINVGRGAVVDEEALIEALRTKLKGAALDVFTVEPLDPASPLWTMENVLISPHTADVTRGFVNRSMKLFVENVPRFINGEPLVNIVDKQLGY
jgi:phosphoglycerate dehydrogenase-like enzyme